MTDDFTEAAQAEAESWIGMDLDDHDNFVSGAVWARDHLASQEADGGHGPRTTAAIREWTGTWPAAQEPTDAEVLAALNAQGVVVSPKMHPAPSLDYWGERDTEAMRAALSAARREPCAECGRTDQHKFSCSHREGRGATIPARRDEEKR